jgi:hypothetical protein
MFTSKFRTRSFLSLGIATLALAIGAASSFANAAVIDEAATAAAKEKMATCKVEFSSLHEHEMCAAEAAYGLVMRQDLTPEQRQALSVEDSRYRALVAQCSRLPDNSRATCASRAGLPSILTGKEHWQLM